MTTATQSNAFAADFAKAALLDPHGSRESYSRAMNNLAEGILRRGETENFTEALQKADAALRTIAPKGDAPKPAPSTHGMADEIARRADRLHTPGSDYADAMRTAYSEIKQEQQSKPEKRKPATVAMRQTAPAKPSNNVHRHTPPKVVQFAEITAGWKR